MTLNAVGRVVKGKDRFRTAIAVYAGGDEAIETFPIFEISDGDSEFVFAQKPAIGINSAA